jgi:hypothetical protein
VAWRGGAGCRAGRARLAPGRPHPDGLSLLSLAGLWLAADAFGWGRDRALWVGFGAFVGLATVARPWWFWENWKARWLRGLIGDEATAACYLLVAAVMVWVGLFTDWHFGRR